MIHLIWEEATASKNPEYMYGLSSFFYVKSFLRTKLKENCEIQASDNV